MHDELQNAAAPDQRVGSWFGSDSLLEETGKKFGMSGVPAPDQERKKRKRL